MPVISTVKAWAVCIVFPSFSLLGTFPTMVLYTAVPGAKAASDNWGKPFTCFSSNLKICVYITYRFLHWILKNKVGSAIITH